MAELAVQPGSHYLAGCIVVLHDPTNADWRKQGAVVRQEPGASALDATEESHVQGRGGRRRGERGTARDYRIFARGTKGSEAGRQGSQGCVAGGDSGERQDPAGPCRRRVS